MRSSCAATAQRRDRQPFLAEQTVNRVTLPPVAKNRSLAFGISAAARERGLYPPAATQRHTLRPPTCSAGVYREFVRKPGIRSPRRRRSALPDCVERGTRPRLSLSSRRGSEPRRPWFAWSGARASDLAPGPGKAAAGDRSRRAASVTVLGSTRCSLPARLCRARCAIRTRRVIDPGSGRGCVESCTPSDTHPTHPSRMSRATPEGGLLAFAHSGGGRLGEVVRGSV